MPGRILVEQLRVFKLYHRRTRPGRRDHQRSPGKGLDCVAGEGASVVVVAAVEVGLSAAGLRGGEVHLVPQPTQQSYRRHSHLGEQRVAQACHQQRNPHCEPSERREDISRRAAEAQRKEKKEGKSWEARPGLSFFLPHMSPSSLCASAALREMPSLLTADGGFPSPGPRRRNARSAPPCD